MTEVFYATAFLALTGAVIHVLFTPLFGWADDLASMSDNNRRSALAMNGMITYALVVIAVADIALALNWIGDEAAAITLLVIAGFWGFRVVFQFLYYDMRHHLSWLFLGAYVFMATTHAVAVVQEIQ